jgi:hypothetical protein
MKSFEVSSQSAKPTEVPSKEDLQTFYQRMDYQKYKLIFLFASSGLRLSELVKFRMDDIDEGTRMPVSKRTVSAQCGPPCSTQEKPRRWRMPSAWMPA